MEKRELYLKIWQELSSEKDMIFLVGPRQAGKTTLAHIISKNFTNKVYFNWDIPEHRVKVLENPSFFESAPRKDRSIPLVIFDEIHKYKDWKNYLKGVYDQYHGAYKFLVSGSGRLDIYQKGGDSLAGRYFLFHLWPFTIAELGGRNREFDDFAQDPLNLEIRENVRLGEIWSNLLELSGFPEPYLSGKKRTYKRWSNIYSQQLIREDIRDLTGIKSVIDIETLYLLLPTKVGSSLSIPSMASDLRVAYNSIRNWLGVLERFFMIFTIGPWIHRIARAIQKERKVYLWDTPRIKEPSARFENAVALELFRAVTNWNDMGYGRWTLHFVKNKQGLEVDFLIANENEPMLLIEAKLGQDEPSKALKKFQQDLQVPAVQLINQGETFRLVPNGPYHILIAPAHQWLCTLP